MSTSFKILVGSYTTVITTLLFSASPPSLRVLSTSPAGSNPSWISSHPRNSSILFATQENSVGQILSFFVNPDGTASQLASAPSGGNGPAYLGVSDDGQEIYIPNYGSGQFESVPLSNDLSSFGVPSPILQFTGSGPKDQQSGSHPHQAVAHGNEILVPDLGADKVWRLTKNGDIWTTVGYVQHPPGSGPRHVVVKDDMLYTIHELSNTLTQHTLPELASGVAPELITTLPVIPTGASNTTLAAGELLLSPNSNAFPEQYLYAGNRLDPDALGDSIAIFSLNPLTLVKQVRTGLQNIRGVMIGGGDGKYVVVGGLSGGGIKVFERVEGGADLKEVASVQGVNSPTSFVFL